MTKDLNPSLFVNVAYKRYQVYLQTKYCQVLCYDMCNWKFWTKKKVSKMNNYLMLRKVIYMLITTCFLSFSEMSLITQKIALFNHICCKFWCGNYWSQNALDFFSRRDFLFEIHWLYDSMPRFVLKLMYKVCMWVI